MTRGLLIVIEGIDGAGTTTQARRLIYNMQRAVIPSHLTREPSDGPIGRLLREFLAGEHAPVAATTLALLFAADRTDHAQREVVPATERKMMVISDRWYHSSFAYQGLELDRTWIETINGAALTPDLTIFLDVPPGIAAERRRLALRNKEIFDDAETQEKLAVAYRELMVRLKEDGENVITIDGTLSENEIEYRIKREVLELYRTYKILR